MIKRIFDFTLALAAILLLSPVMLLVALLIRMDSAGNVLFKQERVGKDGKSFLIYKFRTMVEDAQKIGPTITAQNDPRITQIGQVLRRVKLDELPQFFNVLKGEMSLVGPRPEVPGMVAKYPKDAEKIFSVLPGIIGPNQIQNIDEASMLTDQENVDHFYSEKILPEKIKNDLAYVNNKNPYKDLRFLLGGGAAVIMNSIKLRYILESRRRILFLIVDLCLAVVSFWLAYLLRFEGILPIYERPLLFAMIPFVILLRMPCFITFGLYQTLWQYLGIQELLSIIKAVTVSSLVLPFISFFLQVGQPPRSVLIIDWLLLIMLLGGSRVLFKLTTERLRANPSDDRKNVIIVGAEDAGESLAREFIKRPALGYRPIGFLDDNPEKIGMRIHGIKVIAKISQLASVVRVKKADEVIIALTEGSGEQIKTIIQLCKNLKLPCRIIPHSSAVIPATTLPLKLRPVDISDLLGRELISADQAGIEKFVRDKVILITGGGGSIGSELVRILHEHHPRDLIIVDESENSLYDIEIELRARAGHTQVHCYLQDVSVFSEMEKIFQRHNPQVVYHAAAHKHVPLVELNYIKGISNNVMGSRVMADLAAKYQAETFVLISTDKAINPTSIMGTTKRISELYTQSLKGKTRFLAVRFGNVFNSRGSVVPLFKKQIEEGGPVTITHPDVTRYFMDISEAVYLILQATIMGTHSEIFVLDMGKAIKISELAHDLILMAGLNPKTFPIRYTGLRPAEKLEEELQLDSELAIPTEHKKIKIWRAAEKPAGNINHQIDELLELLTKNPSRDEVLQKLKKIVPEYQPFTPSYLL